MLRVRIMENHMETNMENEIETGIVWVFPEMGGRMYIPGEKTMLQVHPKRGQQFMETAYSGYSIDFAGGQRTVRRCKL